MPNANRNAVVRFIFVLAFLVANLCAAVGNTVYVSSTSGNDANDGSSWEAAKQTIQAGIDTATAGDTVLVTNGSYSTGSRVPPGQLLCQTRVVIDKALAVVSVNGPSNTWIVGQGPRGDAAVRCVWMTNDTYLAGFTLTNGCSALVVGGADENGGGVYATNTSVISNCVIRVCTANKGAGAYGGTLNNCTVSSNSAALDGGGAYNSTLNNCTISGNSSGSNAKGGGAYNCTLNNCTISGNSSGNWGGGAYSSTLNNSEITGNSARNHGGGAYGGTLNNCTISGNSAALDGGGAYNCTLNNCTISGNSSGNWGGGACGGTLNKCTVSSNSTASSGGGAYGGTLNNCTISGNSAARGGGAHACTLNNCTISSNSSGDWGGGAYGGTLNNCTISGNSAALGGGFNGINSGTLNNCTISGNSATSSGGGAYGGTLNNCTLYANTNGGMVTGTARNTISYGNTAYEMADVTASICHTNNPLFVDAAAGNLRLQSNSPCINTGLNAYAPTNVTPYDLDGNPRIAQFVVDKGAYEFQGTPLFELWASAGTHGRIIPSGTIRTNQGANVFFTMLHDAYYHVADVTTNGMSVGSVTNFTWYNVSAPGTITVSFAESTAAHGTPHWWLAQYGWTQNFDVVERTDSDEDGLTNWQEYVYGTAPTNANSDGDQYNDGIEVAADADPLHDDSRTYAAILNSSALFRLYTSNSVLDLSFGEVMLNVESNRIRVRLTMEATEDLRGTNWTNMGAPIEWSCPVNTNKGFFRFLGASGQ